MALRPNFEKNRHFWLGIIGVVVIGGLVIGSSLFGMIGFGSRDVETEFVQAAGLRNGDQVRVAGIPVGKVSGMKLEGDHVLATMQVENKVKLGPDAHATIKMATILGSHYVDLVPGDGSGLKDDRIPISNTTVPYDLAKTIETGTPLLEKIDADKWAQSMNTLNQQLGDSPKMVGDALDSIGVLSQIIMDRRAQVDALLKNFDTVTKVLDDNRNNILTVITQGQAIANRIVERQGLLRNLLDNVAALSEQLQAMGGENNGQFGPLLVNLNTMSEGLQKNQDNLNRMLQLLPPTVRQWNNAAGNGPYIDVYAPFVLFPDNWLCFANMIPGCQ